MKSTSDKISKKWQQKTNSGGKAWLCTGIGV